MLKICYITQTRIFHLFEGLYFSKIQGLAQKQDEGLIKFVIKMLLSD